MSNTVKKKLCKGSGFQENIASYGQVFPGNSPLSHIRGNTSVTEGFRVPEARTCIHRHTHPALKSVHTASLTIQSYCSCIFTAHNDSKIRYKTETSWNSLLCESRWGTGLKSRMRAYILICQREEECMFTQTWCVNMRRSILYYKPLTAHFVLAEEGRTGNNRWWQMYNNIEVIIIRSNAAHTVVHFLLHHIFIHC